jgi:hypothetical protein
MTDQEKRKAVEMIAHEAKRLEEIAGRAGEGMLGYLLSMVQQETERILTTAPDEG